MTDEVQRARALDRFAEKSAQNLIAWCWTPGDDDGDVRRHVVVVVGWRVALLPRVGAVVLGRGAHTVRQSPPAA